MIDRHQVQIELNGQTARFECPSRQTLADALRESCGTRGVRVGCEQGVCGACTVLVDGVSVRSCLMLAAQADGCAVRTVEGASSGDGELSRLQAAFTACHALQCGFCTSGFLAVAEELLAEEPHPTRERIRESISGNLCRCTGYQNIVEAIALAADATGGADGPSPP